MTEISIPRLPKAHDHQPITSAWRVTSAKARQTGGS